MGDAKIDLIRRQLDKNLMPHAYLFSGDQQKKENAVELIAASVIGKEWKKSPDFQEWNTNPISIDDIKILRARAYTTPLVSNKNIFLLQNIENLSRDASGAFLKVLEEPPKSSLILATTYHKKSVLATIRSRFAEVHFPPHPQKQKNGPPKSIDEINDGLWYFENVMRHAPTKQNIYIVENLLNISYAMQKPFINKRLLGDYLNLLLNRQ